MDNKLQRSKAPLAPCYYSDSRIEGPPGAPHTFPGWAEPGRRSSSPRLIRWVCAFSFTVFKLSHLASDSIFLTAHPLTRWRPTTRLLWAPLRTRSSSRTRTLKLSRQSVWSPACCSVIQPFQRSRSPSEHRKTRTLKRLFNGRDQRCESLTTDMLCMRIKSQRFCGGLGVRGLI